MVIFGAGASFDSSDTFRPPRPGAADREERPPLADDLFQQRGFFDIAVREYRECATVATRLRRHFHSTLEGEMERLRLEAQQEEQTAVELHAVRYAAGDVSKFPTHLADEGTSTFDRELDAQEASRLTRELEEIDAALERLYHAPDSVGRDKRTSADIPFEPLDVIPWARTRVDPKR